MSPEMMVDIFRQSLHIVIVIVATLVAPGLLVGLLVSTFQAATQINEASLSFVPKLVATLMALVITGPWILKMILEFSEKLISEIPYLLG